jgi:hypothetical protein
MLPGPVWRQGIVEGLATEAKSRPEGSNTGTHGCELHMRPSIVKPVGANTSQASRVLVIVVDRREILNG